MNTCICPEEIEAWELEAYLHGDAPPRVAQHIARCPGCSARADELRDFHQRLKAALARADCPPTETLFQHRWRQLPRPRVKEIDAHLLRCAAAMRDRAAALSRRLRGVSSAVAPFAWLPGSMARSSAIVCSIRAFRAS